jgi:hypothetical protein
MFEFLLYHRFDDHGTVTRSRYVEVRCERCSHDYGYALTRSRRAIGDRYVWQKREAGRKKALEEAGREVEKKLTGGSEVVPCPCCGWIQQGMLEKARRELYPVESWPALFAFLLAGAALAGLVVLYHLEQNFQLNWVTAWGALMATALLMVCCGIVAFLHQQMRAARFDPNATPAEERIARGQRMVLHRSDFAVLYPAREEVEADE